MTDEPTTKNRPSTTQESSTKSNPSSSIKIGDPKHSDIGDKDDESAKKSSYSDEHSGPDEQGDDEGAEGHAGPRADATKTAPDKHVQGEHSKSSSQQGQQQKQGQHGQQNQQPKHGQQSQQPKQGQQSQQPKQGQQSQQPKQGQPSQKAAPMKSGGESGSDCCGSSAESKAKPGSSSSEK